MYQVTLNNVVLTDQPDLSEFTTQLVRDEEVKGLFVKYPESLTFVGDGYEIIRALFDDGYCNETTVMIEKKCDAGFRELTRAVIFVRTAVLNRSRCTVEVDIQEDTFSARIFNNMDTLVNMGSEESKNGVAITPVPLLGGLELWSSDCVPAVCVVTYEETAGDAGFAHNGLRRHLDIMECIKYLVRWATDGEASVTSNWYATLSRPERISIMTGEELRLGQDAPDKFPEVSLRQCFNSFLQKVDNLFMTIEGTPGNRILRIEDRPFFQTTTPVITLNNVDDIEESIKQELLFSHVKFGSKETLVSSTPDFPILPLLGHQIEEFPIEGTCNVNNPLDLELEFITDHNLILDVLLNDNSAYDSDIFAIQYDPRFTPHKALFGTPLGDDKFTPVYNPRLFNEKIVEKYSLQGGIIKHLPGGAANRFKAQTFNNFSFTTPNLATTVQQIPYFNDFDSPFFDTSNNYGNGTPQGTLVPVNDARYTAPFGGLYTFTTSIVYERTGWVGAAVSDEVVMFLRRFDSGGTVITEVSKTTGTFWLNIAPPQRVQTTTHRVSLEFTTYLQAGDYVQVEGEFITNSDEGLIITSGFPYQEPLYRILSESIFECTGVFDGGGVLTGADPGEKEVIVYNFTHIMTDEQQRLLLADPIKAIAVNVDGSTNTIAYVDNVEMNHTIQEGVFQLITNPDKVLIR